MRNEGAGKWENAGEAFDVSIGNDEQTIETYAEILDEMFVGGALSKTR